MQNTSMPSFPARLIRLFIKKTFFGVMEGKAKGYALFQATACFFAASLCVTSLFKKKHFLMKSYRTPADNQVKGSNICLTLL